MSPRSVVSFASTLGLLVIALPADAQRRPAPAPRQETPEVMPVPEGEGGPSGGGSGPASEVPEKKASRGAPAGYAYSDKPRASSKAASRSRYRTRGPVVNMPGFEQTADGGSRLFVHLSQNVAVEERKAQGSITYVLKGASPRVHNNTNALVTVHFNTPVSRARLVPRGHDLNFVIELRAPATATWKMTEAADKSATLTIDFPKGDYLPGGEETASADGHAAPPPPAKAAHGAKQGSAKTPAAASPEAPAAGPRP